MRKAINTSRLLSLVLCICMVLSLIPAMPMVAEAATVPNYIASIGVSQDGSSGNTGINDCKSELDGHQIIDVDLNDEAGGDYVYMGYKTTTDPTQAITGIVFREGGNPPNSISYGGATFYLVGGSTEANTAKLGGYIDLNAKAGGSYIYTYVTRDANYGAPLTAMTVTRSSSYSGWSAAVNVDGGVMDLNQGASNYYLALHYQRFSGKASSTFYYLTSGGSRTSTATSVSVRDHTRSVSTTPSVPSSVTYDGRTFTFQGWREDNTASSSTVSPSYTYMDSKTYRAVYSARLTLSYHANGGSGAPSSRTAAQYINAGSYSVSKTSALFTLSDTVPTHDSSKCIFLGWSTSSTATTASYQPRQDITISSNTTMYAVWQSEHPERSYVNNGTDHTYLCAVCDKSVTEAHSYDAATQFCVCGAMNTDAVATVSKNGKVVAAYLSLNDAIQAVKDCTAADKAVVTILKKIDLGENRQEITSGVFTIDLNGCEISNTTSDFGTLYINGAAADVTIQGTGENSKIIGTYAAIEVQGGAKATIAGGAIISDGHGMRTLDSTVTVSGGTIICDNYGVCAFNSTVTVSGGSITGYNGMLIGKSSTATITGDAVISGECSGVSASNNSTVTISGGTITGVEEFGVIASSSTVTISGGSISGGERGVNTSSNSTVNISGGSISGDSGVRFSMSTATISGGSISGNLYDDIQNYDSTITLTLGKDGVGATFPGGISVFLDTLNAILGEGVAYWQGNTMILPADDATEITGGDVVIKAVCQHPGDKTYTNNGADHSYTCSGCNITFTDVHSYTNGLCICGAYVADAVATVSKNGVATGAYTTLNDAIEAVKNCTADDKAVVTLLQNIALGDSYQKITSGVFTIDLNGHEISSKNITWGALYLTGNSINVTIQGAGKNSKITGSYAGIEMSSINGALTITGGTISGGTYGVRVYYSAVTISGGTISGNTNGVSTCKSNAVTISGGTISGDCGVRADGCAVEISGGSISGNNYDIYNDNSTIALTMGKNGVGATFPGGIEVKNTTLNAILGEGAAYWQGDTMILLADDAKEITGGDVVIKAVCPHTASRTGYVDLKDGISHSYICSGCNNTLTEPHSYTNYVCACGTVSPDAVATVISGDETVYFATFADALSAWTDGTTLQLLQNVEYAEMITVTGKRVLDLNGKVIHCQCSDSNMGFNLFNIEGDLTIRDSGENGTITLRGTNYAKVITSVGNLTIESGQIDGQHFGINCEGGTLNISGGTVSAYYAVDLVNTEATVSNGKIQGDHIAVDIADGASLVVTGGEISASGVAIQVGRDAKSAVISGGSLSATGYGVECYGNVTISGNVVMDAEYGDFCFSDDFPDARVIIDCPLADGSYTVKMDAPGAFGVAGEGITLNPKAFTPYNEECKIVEDDAGLSMVPCDHSNGINADGACLDCGMIAQFNVLVDGVIISTANMSDVLGDGTVSYDPATNTLILNNAKIEDAVYDDGDMSLGLGILAQEDLNIRLVGDNFISGAASEDMSVAILSYGNLTFTGDGTLTAQCGQAQEMLGIVAIESFTVDANASVTVSGLVQCGSYSIPGQFNGIMKVGTGPYDYVACGNAVLSGDLTVNGNNDTATMEHIGEFTVMEGATLTIADGVTLTIADNSELASTEVNNIITNKSKVILEGSGTIVNLGEGICTETATHCCDSESKCLICGYICLHNWLDATCVAPKTCTECGATEGEALGHTEEIVPGKAPTCTNTGLTDGVKCAVCGEILIAQEELPATGEHIFGDGDYICDCGVVYNGIYEETNGDLYYVENGVAIENKGLVKTTDDNGHIHYYYFGCGIEGCSAGDACQGSFKAQKSNRHYAQITNGLLVPGTYTIGEDGVIEHIDDTSVTGIYEIDGVKYYLMDGVKAPKGLVEIDGKFYYARSSGALVIGQDYWISKTNGLTHEGEAIKAGSYTFDETGVLVFKVPRNGFYYEGDGWYYYVNDAKNYAGLIWCDGPEGNDPGYYYINSKAKLITDCTYWISKNNGYMKNDAYCFDENGTMYTPIVEVKNGFYYETDGWYYYVDGAKNYAGLIWCDGPEGNDPGYYYINSKCKLITDCTYYISKNNGLMGNQNYTFDANGKMVQETGDTDELLSGFVEEGGEVYYYVDGIKTYAGLILVDGDYYYVNSKCMVIRGCTYWISKNNGYMKNGNYTFDADGKMIQA